MNYQKHYTLLVERAKTRHIEPYVEEHHVVPKCMGGSNDKANLVKLTPEEHYVAHQLLVKIYPGHAGLMFAVYMMTVGEKRNNKLFGWVRRLEHPHGMLGKKHSQTSKQLMAINRLGEKNGMYGKNHTSTALEKMKSHIKTEEHIRKISEAMSGDKNPNFGQPRSNETKQRISEGVKNSASVTCPHCNALGKKSPMARWHFDNCRMRLIGALT